MRHLNSCVFLLVIVIKQGDCRYPVPFVSPETCGGGEYFDPSRLACRLCTEDERQKGMQRKTANRLSCECLPNHKIIAVKNGRITCEPCPETEVTSSDGWQCSRCSSSNPYLNDTHNCSPCLNGISLETPELELQCIPCKNSTTFDYLGKKCIRCPADVLLASNGSCNCPKDKFTMSGGTCIPNSFLLPADEAWATLTLQSGQKLKSAVLHEHLQAVIYQCKVLQNWTACQMLGNLCVLTLYKTESATENAVPCDQYLKTASQDSQTPVQIFSLARPEGVPRLFYSDGDPHLELSKTNVPNKFSLNVNSQFSTLKFVAATYSLQGLFLGMRNVTPSLLQLCKSSSEDIEKGFTFGSQFQRSCKLGAQTLWSEASLVFYELYLLHDLNGKQELYPVPVLIRNLQKRDEFVNKGIKESRWHLTRRFFLIDPVSGIENEESPSMPPAKTLRYISDLSIRIKVRDEDEEDHAGSIFPPLLILTYSEINRDDLHHNTHVQISFGVSYEMSQTRTFYSIVVAVAVLSVLSLVWSLFQTWSWSRRAGKKNIDIQSLGKLLVFSSGNLANVFFLVVFCASVNWLVIFKRQDVVHLLLPTPEQEESFLVYISAAFALKCLQIFHMLAIQSSIDIFFIDWERPKGNQRGVSARRTSVRVVDETNVQSNEGGSLSGVGSGVSKAVEKAPDAGGVSIWRTYFVASTWADLQTSRRVKPSIQLFMLLFCLQVFGLENLSFADPDGSLANEGSRLQTPFSATCRFAIASSMFLTIALAQYMIHRILYERFFEDKIQQFIDLCSVSNISVFIMSLPKYGYYIHGRSAHGCADVNMKEMHEHLRREEEDLCGHRGLLPNTEQQTFCMALPEGVGEQYRRLLLPLTSYSQTADRMQGVGGRLARVDVDRVVHAYQMVNKFLSGFIEHAFKDLDYGVRDHLLMENLLDVEFTEVQDRGLFYNDNGHSFDSLLFCGQESSLVIFEALLFCLVDLIAKSFTLAAVLSFLFYKVIEAIRKSSGRRNLVRKALVDERFLSG